MLYVPTEVWFEHIKREDPWDFFLQDSSGTVIAITITITIRI